MSTPIPQIRDEMHELADKHNIPRLHELAEETRRKPPVTRAAPRSRKMTPALRREIIHVHRQHPDWTQQQIAVAVGVIAGRVSETLAA